MLLLLPHVIIWAEFTIIESVFFFCVEDKRMSPSG
jgi:hypothetical protein